MIRVSRRRPVPVDVDEAELLLDIDFAALLACELDVAAAVSASGP